MTTMITTELVGFGFGPFGVRDGSARLPISNTPFTYVRTGAGQGEDTARH